jgi:hypothetical protein
VRALIGRRSVRVFLADERAALLRCNASFAGRRGVRAWLRRLLGLTLEQMTRLRLRCRTRSWTSLEQRRRTSTEWPPVGSRRELGELGLCLGELPCGLVGDLLERVDGGLLRGLLGLSCGGLFCLGRELGAEQRWMWRRVARAAGGELSEEAYQTAG